MLDRISNTNKQKIGFGGPGGGPLHPGRDLVTILGGFRSTAEMATRFRPKNDFPRGLKKKSQRSSDQRRAMEFTDKYLGPGD